MHTGQLKITTNLVLLFFFNIFFNIFYKYGLFEEGFSKFILDYEISDYLGPAKYAVMVMAFKFHIIKKDLLNEKTLHTVFRFDITIVSRKLGKNQYDTANKLQFYTHLL